MAIHWEPVGDGRVLAVSDDHRFGTDTVILSYFAAPKTAGEAVCDLGTGCGCIPFLLLNQPVAPRRILGVDKQPDAIMLCRLSADKNKLHGMLQFAEADWCFPKASQLRAALTALSATRRISKTAAAEKAATPRMPPPVTGRRIR